MPVIKSGQSDPAWYTHKHILFIERLFAHQNKAAFSYMCFKLKPLIKATPFIHLENNIAILIAVVWMMV